MTANNFLLCSKPLAASDMFQHRSDGETAASLCSILGCNNIVDGRKYCQKHTAKRSHNKFFVKSRIKLPTPTGPNPENASSVSDRQCLGDSRELNSKSVLSQANEIKDGGTRVGMLPTGNQTTPVPGTEPRPTQPSPLKQKAGEPAEHLNGAGSGYTSIIFEPVPASDTRQGGQSTVPRTCNHDQALLQNFCDLQTADAKEPLQKIEQVRSISMLREISGEVPTGRDKKTAICISSDSEGGSINYTYAKNGALEHHGRRRTTCTPIPLNKEEPIIIDNDDDGEIDISRDTATTTSVQESQSHNTTNECPPEPRQSPRPAWLKSVPAIVEPEISIVNRPSPAPKPKDAEPKAVPAKRVFDSDAFDEMIYRQFKSKPRTRPCPISTEPNSRLYLPVNPAIHRSHDRTQKWHDDKTREIQERGSRKRWFGKAAARLQWLYEKEQLEQTQRQQHAQISAANTSREILPLLHSQRQDPKPRTSVRALDFGDVREEALPADVRANPAWLKAAEWHRRARNGDLETNASISRKRRLTWRQYTMLEREAARKMQG